MNPIARLTIPCIIRACVILAQFLEAKNIRLPKGVIIMDKRVIYASALAVALGVGPAYALQNVANTSQRGSLLVFPL
ncbi:MAG TPA: hypothetical protein VHT02_08565, partial [Methylocella sp.]|nr:hypothetical protein [Methylocella sp.]